MLMRGQYSAIFIMALIALAILSYRLIMKSLEAEDDSDENEPPLLPPKKHMDEL